MTDFNEHLGNDAFPGMGAVVEQPVRNIFRDGRAWHRMEGIKVDKDSVDAGNTGNTTTLRPGLALFKTAGGKWVPADHTDAPDAVDVGPGECVILGDYLNLKDKSGTIVDKPFVGLIAGFVFDDKIIWVDAGYEEAGKAALPLVDFR